MRRSRKSLAITTDPALAIWSASGPLYGARLLSLEWRRTEDTGEVYRPRFPGQVGGLVRPPSG